MMNCTHCEKVLEIGQAFPIFNDAFCEECWLNESAGICYGLSDYLLLKNVGKCDQCGDSFDEEEEVEVTDKVLCQSCYFWDWKYVAKA